MSFASFLEGFMLNLINEERALHGLAPLTLEINLNRSADAHSEWMINSDTFSHTGVNSSSALDRMLDAGFDIAGGWRTGENLAGQSIRGPDGLRDDVINLHEGLMNSPGHRANILNADFTHIGIGITTGDMSFGSGNMFDSIVVTQNFGTTGGLVDQDLIGTNQRDDISGGSGDDAVRGFNGDDHIRTFAGNDSINAGTGNDTVYGGSGNDVLHGLAGADSLSGDIGDDRIIGGIGNDVVLGSSGNDRLFGGTEHDILDGGQGNDIILGQGGFDRINGGTGNDVMGGGRQADIFEFENNFGVDRIIDFDVANTHERIDLSGVDAITNFNDLVANHLQQASNYALIDDGNGNTIRLDNVVAADLTADDFIF